MAFDRELYGKNKPLDLLLRGIEGHGLFLREWSENGVHIAAVGKLPDSVSLEELNVRDVVASSFPGVADTRYEAVHIALNGFLETEGANSEQTTQKIESYDLIDPQLAAEVAFGGLKRTLSARA